MRKLKGLLVSTIVICMLCMLLPMTVQAEEIASGKCGDNLTWMLTDDRVLTISGTGQMHSGTSEELWNDYRTMIQKVILPDGMENISNKAFANCTYLRDVVIPDSVTHIGDEAFAGCRDLFTITIPQSVIFIGEKVFWGAGENGPVIYGYPGSCAETYADENQLFFLYAEDAELENLQWSIKDGVLTVSGTGIIPAKWRPGEDWEFTSLVISEGITGIEDGQDGVVGAVGSFCALRIYSVSLPDSLEYIGEGAFTNCGYLRELVIPDGVKHIGSSAFEGCISLQSVVIPGSVTYFGFDVFYGSDYWMPIYGYVVSHAEFYAQYHGFPFVSIGEIDSTLPTWDVEDGVLTISGNGEIPFYWRPYASETINSVVISEGITSIQDCDQDNGGTNSLFCSSGVTAVDLPSTMEYIGSYAFYWCRLLSDIEIPYGVTDIGGCAFYGCVSLTSIEIPDSVTTMGGAVFDGCSSLMNIVIGDGLTSIAGYSFYGCESLTHIDIPDNVTKIGSYAFADCSSLEDVVIGDGVTVIGDHAFRWCNSLRSIEIPGNVDIIENSAFSYCKGLNEVVIGDGVTIIGDFAFYWCEHLRSIEIPDSVTSIEDRAFQNTNYDLTIICNPGSFAENYAIRNGFRYKWFQEHIHSYDVLETVPPTCTAEGYTTYTCACGDGYVLNDTPPLYHDYIDGTCTRCGEADPDYNPFTDVPENKWFAEPVLWAVESGVTSGTTATTFSPDEICTRAQVVTFLWRAMGVPEPESYENPFTDVREKDYYYKAVLWAVEKGITTGTSEAARW